MRFSNSLLKSVVTVVITFSLTSSQDTNIGKNLLEKLGKKSLKVLENIEKKNRKKMWKNCKKNGDEIIKN